MYITDEVLDRWLKEDVPYFDLTTHALGIAHTQTEATITFQARNKGVLCGSEEVTRLFEKVNVKTSLAMPSGAMIDKNDIVLQAEGLGENLHLAWKVALNIFEYACGIASKTNKLVTLAREINPKAEILTTRKIFPGTKDLSVKAVLAGGGSPHRLGLSETIVVFKNHLNLVGGIDCFIENIAEYKQKALEKRFVVEAETPEEAIKFCKAGVDAIQFDKFSLDDLAETVKTIRHDFKEKNIVLLATGGVTPDNVQDYTRTGVDGIVTTSVYNGTPFDMGAKICKK